MKRTLFTYGFGLPALVVALDQLTKYWATKSFGLPMSICRDNPGVRLNQEFIPVFDLTLLCNTGVSFGFLGGESSFKRLLLSLFALVMAGLLLFLLSRTHDLLSKLGIGLIIGGAIGNVIDRSLFGAVTDFVDVTDWLPIFPFVFNLADSAITCGVIALLLAGFAPQARQNSKTTEN